MPRPKMHEASVMPSAYIDEPKAEGDRTRPSHLQDGADRTRKRGRKRQDPFPTAPGAASRVRAPS